MKNSTMIRAAALRALCEGIAAIPHLPLLDRPRRGWPCVVVRAVAKTPGSAGAVALIQSELSRWGIASIDGSRHANQWIDVPNLDEPVINASLCGCVELMGDRIRLVAGVNDASVHAVMEADPSIASQEVAMWFTEHLWARQEAGPN